MKHVRTIALAALLMVVAATQAQCTFENTAFKNGEFLTYNLYYNWKFIWVKAGTASMYTVTSHRNGQPAYLSKLTTRGNGRLDDYFVLRDTLLCYSTLDLVPLYFRKGAREGKRYSVDEVYYSYPNGKCQIRQHRKKNNRPGQWQTKTYNECIYDMLNMFLRARSFNPESWKKGHTVKFKMADGNSVDPEELRYLGKTTIKADDGNKYRCLQLSYVDHNDGNPKEIIRFYVTDDLNHIPIRLDMFLKFGSAKAFLVSMKGARNKVTSRVK